MNLIMESTRILIYLLALFCLSNALSSVEVTKAKHEEEIHLRQIYSDMEKGIKNFIRDNFKTVIRVVQEKSQEFNLSTSCKNNAFKLMLGIRDLKFWALNFIDATGKPSDGLLSGNGHMYGNYDQCLNSTVLKKNGAVDFRGQYCLVSISTYLPNPELRPNSKERADLVKKLTQNLTEAIALYAYKSEVLRSQPEKFGLCVPSGCGNNDIDQLIQYAGKQILLNLTLDYCETEDSLTFFTPTRTVILCLYLFFILLVIIGSAIDLYSTRRKITFENPLMRTLLCFSFPHNFQKFANTEVNEGNLSYINGIRVLTLFYVVFGHHFILKASSSMSKNLLYRSILNPPRFFFQIVLNGNFAADIFLFIGGFVHCYMRAKKNFTFFSFSRSFMLVVYRLMRIYPVYIFSILLALMFYPRGPMVHHIDETFGEACRTQWWKNILFINNIYHLENQCFPHSWYLAADTQYFLVALFTIPLLFRNAKVGVLVHLAIILFSTTYATVQVWVEQYLPTITVKFDVTDKDREDMYNMYVSPFTHASAYFGGVLLGFFITRKRNLTPSKITLVFGWIAATTLFLTMVFYPKRWNSGVPYTRLGGALYFTMSKLICSWSVGWLIFCCFTGHGGFLNYILSWKMWIPLNRLCLSAYLISAILQLYYFTNLRTPQDISPEIEIWGFFGDTVLTLLLALPMTLLFESPFIALQNVIFSKKEIASKPKVSEMNEMNGKIIIIYGNDTKSENNKNSIKI